MRARLDSGRTPEWRATIIVRGIDVETLSPLEAADRAVVSIGREPGALTRAWRWLFGRRGGAGDAAETEQVRRVVLGFTPPAHRGLIASLSGGELLAVLGTYLGAQRAWFAEVQRRAEEEARAASDARPAGPAAAPTARAASSASPRGSRAYQTPYQPLIPGRLPAWLKALNDDGRASGVEGGA